MRSYLIGRIRSVLLIAATASLSIALAPAPAVAVDPSFTFKGGGWGHGIGLSQYGAQAYAKKGWKYGSIITHYYQGTRLVTKPTVKLRVNIEDGGASRTQWKIRAGGKTALLVAQESDPTVRQTLNATSSYWITTAKGGTQLRADSSGAPGRVLKTFSGACYASAGGLVQVLSSSGPFNHKGVRWRGTIHFKPASTTSNKALAINYVPLEEYLYGVVPRESPSSWHPEALKAQAVAARSYAYQDGVERRMIYCTTKSQVYNGHSRPGHAHEVASTNSAVDATKGKLVWYGSQTAPVKTYFSSCSGGHTANIQDVWTSASPKPYYKGVADATGLAPTTRGRRRPTPPRQSPTRSLRLMSPAVAASTTPSPPPLLSQGSRPSGRPRATPITCASRGLPARPSGSPERPCNPRCGCVRRSSL